MMSLLINTAHPAVAAGQTLSEEQNFDEFLKRFFYIMELARCALVVLDTLSRAQRLLAGGEYTKESWTVNRYLKGRLSNLRSVYLEAFESGGYEATVVLHIVCVDQKVKGFEEFLRCRIPPVIRKVLFKYLGRCATQSIKARLKMDYPTVTQASPQPAGQTIIKFQETRIYNSDEEEHLDWKSGKLSQAVQVKTGTEQGMVVVTPVGQRNGRYLTLEKLLSDPQQSHHDEEQEPQLNQPQMERQEHPVEQEDALMTGAPGMS
jgi:hypothetical protein